MGKRKSTPRRACLSSDFAESASLKRRKTDSPPECPSEDRQEAGLSENSSQESEPQLKSVPETVISPDYDSGKDVVIAEVGLVRFPLDSPLEAVNNASVRIQYTNLSKNSVFGQRRVENVSILVFSEELGVVFTGSLDDIEAVDYSFVYLVKKQCVGLRYVGNGRMQVFLTGKVFVACETGQVSKNYLQTFMVWLRPELSVDVFYGMALKENGKNEVFDPSAFYAAMKRTRDEPCLTVVYDELIPKLRRYQQQAVYWMLKREKEPCKPVYEHPLWLSVDSLDSGCSFYYNIFSGLVSREPRDFCNYVHGGILADEMGLGKTVEVLACILGNRYTGSSEFESAQKKVQEAFNRRKLERIECVCRQEHSEGVMVQCDYCDAWQHATCVGYSPPPKRKKRNVVKHKGYSLAEDDQRFACNSCAEIITSAEVEGVSGATLIVCPSPILKQWQEEITRHTKRGSLKVLVYEGVRKGCSALGQETSLLRIVGAYDFAQADIVITTYDVLRSDLYHDVDEDNQRSMRFEKRYQVVNTPLTKLTWWRICLDEAQMVENNTARATDMAMRLDAQHRWCVSGTPIQRGLEDLYGLLNFLRAEPFDNHSWWIQAIKQPYEEGKQGALDFTHQFFREFMWRSMKNDVEDQLNIPPQEEQVTWLKFSGVESHFYRQQHKQCAENARQVISKFSRIDGPLNHIEASKLMNPLLRLRQACCHPQVGSAGIRTLQASPMTMDEILEVLIEKAKTEGEEAQRQMIGALNGLAALAIIDGNIPGAVEIYREALAAAEENANSFRVDPLQKLHTLFNLEQLLSDKEHTENIPSENIPRTLRDDQLRRQYEDIRYEYMSGRRSKLAVAQNEFYTATNEVINAQCENKSFSWWLDVFATVKKKKKETELLERINTLLQADNVSRNASSLIFRCTNMDGLMYLMQQELDAMDQKREVLLESLVELDKTMVNPDPVHVKRSGQCPQCQSAPKGETCVHCDMEIFFQDYANRIFFLTSLAAGKNGVVTAEEALAAQQRSLLKNKEVDKRTSRPKGAIAARVLNRPSETEQILSFLVGYMKPEHDKDAVENHLHYLEALRSEYAAARSLAGAQRAVLCALDEMNMSTTRLCLQDEDMEEEEHNPYGIRISEIPQRNATLTADKFVAVDELSRCRGQLRYLKGLQARKKSNQGDTDGSSSNNQTEEACPICQDKLDFQIMVLPCGHLLCCKCMDLVVKKAPTPPGGAHLKRIPCPTCRQRAYVSDVALANTEKTNTSHNSEVMNTLEEEKEDEESLITVSGSYGTKIEAVIKRILRLQAHDPFTKILVFSTWHEVLDLLEHAFNANRVAFDRIKGRRKMDEAIRRFKHEDVQVLLLPIQHGANGLNLVEAQHVILVEPLLNPAAEAQAMNRVHRIGQHHKTFVHRFIVRDTVEENIYRLGQRRGTGTCLPMKQKEQKLTVSDMNDLLGWEEEEPKEKENDKDKAKENTNNNVSARFSLRDLPPAQAAAAAAEARFRMSLNCEVSVA